MLDFQAHFRRLFGPGWKKKNYLLAVSGGVDSVCLLDLVRSILPAEQIAVAHFDHRVRAGESEKDARWVENLCRRYQVKFYLGQRKGASTSEDALRRERYDFLRSHPSDFILTAHHAEDQLETLLMRLIRGTGLKGLGAMAPRKGKIARPLLEVSKDALVQYAQARGLKFRQDRSNQTLKYFRNRVRARLLPPLYELSREFGGKEPFLERTSALLAEIRRLNASLRRATEKDFRSLCTDTALWIRLNPAAFLELSPASQRTLLRRILEELGVPEVSRAEIEKLRRFFPSSRKRTQTLSGLIVERSCDRVYFLKTNPVDNAWMEQKTGVWSCAALNFTLEVLGEPPLELRFFREGDRQGRQKLKKLFLEHRIPAPERSLVPLAVDKRSQEVVWFYPQQNDKVRVIQQGFPFTVTN